MSLSFLKPTAQKPAAASTKPQAAKTPVVKAPAKTKIKKAPTQTSNSSLQKLEKGLTNVIDLIAPSSVEDEGSSARRTFFRA